MMTEIGKKYLITTSEWFFAPDGSSYRAVFGTVKGIYNDTETLGIKTNHGSTNWYIVIGDMIISGCQIKYAVKTDVCNLDAAPSYTEKDGICLIYECPSKIYNADYNKLEEFVNTHLGETFKG